MLALNSLFINNEKYEQYSLNNKFKLAPHNVTNMKNDLHSCDTEVNFIVMFTHRSSIFFIWLQNVCRYNLTRILAFLVKFLKYNLFVLHVKFDKGMPKL